MQAPDWVFVEGGGGGGGGGVVGDVGGDTRI